jgi:hypothetical protein
MAARMCHGSSVHAWWLLITTGRQMRVSRGMTWGRCYDLKNISAEKFDEDIGVFWLSSYCKYFLQKYDQNIGFCEKRHFFAINWQKSQKIVIITSTP